MAILALPLVISILKPRASHLSFLCSRIQSPSRFCKSPPQSSRRIAGTSVRAISTSAIQEHASTEQNNEAQKASVPTFQQAIQRLQVNLEFVPFFVCIWFFLFLCLFYFYRIFPWFLWIILVNVRNIGRQLDVLWCNAAILR